ncbi:hypothetical protein Hanom_Chr12g01145181 [Helianthus anomalus]
MRPAMAVAFHLSEVVDAYHHDAWWIRKVIASLEYAYEFPIEYLLSSWLLAYCY